MAEYKNVIYEKREHVAIITNNNPERLNALSVGLRKDIDDAMMEAANDTDVRAIIWTGAGRAFSAGANMGGRGDEGTGTPDPSLQGLVGNVIAAEIEEICDSKEGNYSLDTNAKKSKSEQFNDLFDENKDKKSNSDGDDLPF